MTPIHQLDLSEFEKYEAEYFMALATYLHPIPVWVGGRTDLSHKDFIGKPIMIYEIQYADLSRVVFMETRWSSWQCDDVVAVAKADAEKMRIALSDEIHLRSYAWREFTARGERLASGEDNDKH